MCLDISKSLILTCSMCRLGWATSLFHSADISRVPTVCQTMLGIGHEVVGLVLPYCPPACLP